MTDPSRNPKPLRILTLDGGGLQAVSTLLILNKVLEKIAKENGDDPEHRKPRPCDVFDTIAGIGAGGWLAILLGRFRMDITSCMVEWQNLMKRIAPKSKTEEVQLRLLHNCYYNTERLVEQVEYLTQVYGTGDLLFDPDPIGARTRHVFVMAMASDTGTYNLFRSYETPKSTPLASCLLEGPKNPSSFKISRAFGVTGATRYFTNPWEEQMERSGKMKFSNTKFPEPQNITALAMDEMWGIYGTEAPLSVVLNIGPGLPSDFDIKSIARRFSWGSDPNPAQEATSTNRARSPAFLGLQSNDKKQDIKRLSGDPTFEPIAEGERNGAVAQTNAHGSIKAGEIYSNLRRLEDGIETEIKEKLNIVHPEAKLYYRLAPAQAPQGTSQNDATAPALMDATLAYLSDPRVDATIDELAKRLSEILPNS